MKKRTEKEWDLFCDALAFADLVARRDFLDRDCADAADWLQNPSPAPPSNSPKQIAP